MTVEFESFGELTEQQLEHIEQRLGSVMPDQYRGWLVATNGGKPHTPAVLQGQRFLWEQRAYGLRPDSPLDDLVHAYSYLQDRLTADYLAVSEVSGGLLVVKVRGDAGGSVWFWVDDDPRASDEHTAGDIERLLSSCWATWDDFVSRLEPAQTPSPKEIRSLLERGGIRIRRGSADPPDPDA
jgi:hypothetical protein